MDQELVSRIAATAKSDLQLPDEQLPQLIETAYVLRTKYKGKKVFPEGFPGKTLEI